MMELVSDILVNFIDIFIAYYFYCGLVNKKAKLPLTLFTFAILYSIVLKFVDNTWDGYIYRIFSTSIIILFYKVLSKRRKLLYILHIYAIYFYAIYFIGAVCIQLPFLFFINVINISLSYIYLLGQTLTLLIVILLYMKVPLYKIVNNENELLIKSLIFGLAYACLIVLFVANYEYTYSYIAYGLLLLILIFVVFYQILKRVSFFSKEMPARLHDVGNVMARLQALAYSRQDKEFQREIDDAIKILKISTSINKNEILDAKQSIVSLIEKKKQKSTKKLCIVSDINYTEPHPMIGTIATEYMLSVLLDNAIEAVENIKSVNPIIIKIKINSNCVILSIGNEYESHGVNNFQKMLDKGYSTKETEGRGHGLSNLLKFVNERDGELIINYEYHERYKCSYLVFTIDIGNLKIYTQSWIEQFLSL